MTERPILFSAPMVRAILAGTKTQTRRVVKPDGKYRLDLVCPADGGPSRCPYGQPGDRLWVREAWRVVWSSDGEPPRSFDASYRFWYEADAPLQDGYGKLRPSIHMPRCASRITLKITGVRVERLQDISIRDCIAEGIHCGGPENPDGIEKRDYRDLWASINGPESWDANPWVWVIEFRRIAPATHQGGA